MRIYATGAHNIIMYTQIINCRKIQLIQKTLFMKL